MTRGGSVQMIGGADVETSIYTKLNKKSLLSNKRYFI